MALIFIFSLLFPKNYKSWLIWPKRPPLKRCLKKVLGRNVRGQNVCLPSNIVGIQINPYIIPMY